MIKKNYTISFHYDEESMTLEELLREYYISKIESKIKDFYE